MRNYFICFLSFFLISNFNLKGQSNSEPIITVGDTYPLLIHKFENKKKNSTILVKLNNLSSWFKVYSINEDIITAKKVDNKKYYKIIDKEELEIDIKKVSDWLEINGKFYSGIFGSVDEPPFLNIKFSTDNDIYRFISTLEVKKKMLALELEENIYRLGIDSEELEDSNLAKLEKELLYNFYTNVNYPAVARENGIEGLVVVQFDIEENGDIAHIEIFQANHPLLDAAVVTTLEKLKFGIVEINGKVEKIKMIFPANFRLE